jgi:hypothetical protein
MLQPRTAARSLSRFIAQLRPAPPGPPGATVAALLPVALIVAALAFGAASASAATYRIPPSISGSCSVDVTSALLSWISSVPDHATLSFGRRACYRIEGTLEVRSRRGLDFEGRGSTFRSFDRPSDQRAIWRAWQSSGLVFRDMTIRGSYRNGGTFTSALQHAHGIDLRGTSADIASVRVEDVAGDCVYFGLGTDDNTRSSGTLYDSSCSGTSRNAVSVTAGNRILVQHVTTNRIGYDVFDVEPNVAPGNWGSTDVTFRENTIGSYYLSAYSLVENGPISHQVFRDNRLVGASLRAFIGPVGPVVAPARQVTIAGNVSEAARMPSSLRLSYIDGLTVTDNRVPAFADTRLSVYRSCGVSIIHNALGGRWTGISSAGHTCRAQHPQGSTR